MPRYIQATIVTPCILRKKNVDKTTYVITIGFYAIWLHYTKSFTITLSEVIWECFLSMVL